MGSGKIKLKAPDQSSKLIMEFGGVQKLEKRKRRVKSVEGGGLELEICCTRSKSKHGHISLSARKKGRRRRVEE